MLTPKEEHLRWNLKIPVYQRELCLQDVALIAGDTKYTGFEDPRAAATDRIVQSENRCERQGCIAKVKKGVYEDEYTFEVVDCQKVRICAREVEIDKSTEISGLEERRSNEQLGYLCTITGCEYSFGWYIDGVSGNVGSCIKNSPPERAI